MPGYCTAELRSDDVVQACASVAETHLTGDLVGIPAPNLHELSSRLVTLTGPHPVRVTAAASQDLRLALDAARFDEIALELRVVALEGTAPAVDVSIETGMQLDTDHGWLTLATFPQVTSAPVVRLRSLRAFLRYLRWRVTALSGAGAAATFVIDGVASAWRDEVELHVSSALDWLLPCGDRDPSLPVQPTRVAARVRTANDLQRVPAHLRPIVARPATVHHVREIVTHCVVHDLTFAVHNGAHHDPGCASTPDVFIETTSLDAIRDVSSNRIVLEAGVPWSEVVQICHAVGAVPELLPEWLDQSVGDFLALGGLTCAAHRIGLAVDSVLELEVVNARGDRLQCSPTTSPDVFRAALTGGRTDTIITSAALPLSRWKSETCTYSLTYDDVAELMTALAIAAAERRFDSLRGIITSTPENNWLYMLQGTICFDADSVPTRPSWLTRLETRSHDTTFHAQRFREWLFSSPNQNSFSTGRVICRGWDFMLSAECAQADIETLLSREDPDDQAAPTAVLVPVVRPTRGGSASQRLFFATTLIRNMGTPDTSGHAHPARDVGIKRNFQGYFDPPNKLKPSVAGR